MSGNTEFAWKILLDAQIKQYAWNRDGTIRNSIQT